MLARFLTSAYFSLDSKDGGKDSNSKFVPYMIQMARHLLDQSSVSERRTMAIAISSYLNSSPSNPSSNGTEETVQLMMVTSLLTEYYQSWLQHRPAFLQRVIYDAYIHRSSGTSDDDLLSIHRPTGACLHGSNRAASEILETNKVNSWVIFN